MSKAALVHGSGAPGGRPDGKSSARSGRGRRLVTAAASLLAGAPFLAGVPALASGLTGSGHGLRPRLVAV
ncbi:MAG TPA: hypothetical protein VEH29_15750, partial [Acidimicrobiales bacterium]|nr:hypothetical protein [Acidimicrobiales bacterium]